MIPLGSSSSARRRSVELLNVSMIYRLMSFQYGDVFTFILLGRRVTVALGPKGNNFILGGKSTVFNAEDAYTVRYTTAF